MPLKNVSKERIELASRIRDRVKELVGSRIGEVVHSDIRINFARVQNVVHVSVWDASKKKVFSANWGLLPAMNGIMSFRPGPWIETLFAQNLAGPSSTFSDAGAKTAKFN